MPNRILKESVCTSPEVEELSDGAEVLFYRLTVKADDHGRHDGRLAVMKALCFPIRKRMTESKLARQLVELMVTTPDSLVKMYEVEGRPYLQIVKWEKHQRVRATASKFPPPSDGKPLSPADICPQMFANGARGQMSATRGPIRKRSTKSGSGSKAKAGSDVESVGNPGAGEPENNGRVQAPEPENLERVGMSAEARALADKAEAHANRGGKR
jgi:hypothetical protein